MEAPDLALETRAAWLFRQAAYHINHQTDRLFAILMVLQWVAGVVVAVVISPRAWEGMVSHVHLHVWMAIFLGGIISSFPIALAILRPGKAITRHTIAVAQMLTSALLIHLSGGRIETHFHVFGSLAFLSFYRDWRVLVTATITIGLDHVLRGLFWPESVYGVLNASPWRSVEHAGWVVFEVIVLSRSCVQNIQSLWEISRRQATLEALNNGIEQKIRERTDELQASEERFRSLSASAPVGIFETDSAGLCLYCNPAGLEITGLSGSAALGLGWRQVVHPEDVTMLSEWLEVVGKGGEFSREFRFQRPDGRVRWVHTRSNPVFSEDGLLHGHVGTIEDITASKQIESEWRAARQAADAANRAKSEFLANVSHEIRTPINGVMGMTELALDTSLTDEQRDYLETIQVSADSLLLVVNDILDFSKVEAGKLDLERIEFDVEKTIRMAVQPLSVQARRKGLALSCEISAEVPSHVLGDPGRLRQIIINLVSNAVKFTEHGKVGVQVELDRQNYAEICLRFSVSDTGIGIPPEKGAVIFHPFEQADTSTTRKYGGTGLGLAICSRLVSLMGGRIWMDSEVGFGTTCHFMACFGRVERAASKAPLAPALQRPLIEDGQPHALGLTEVLSH